MSDKGDPYDNAMIESFFSTLRAELTDLERFPTRQVARTAVFEFIEVFYNRQRLHSSLGYRSPRRLKPLIYPECCLLFILHQNGSRPNEPKLVRKFMKK